MSDKSISFVVEGRHFKNRTTAVDFAYNLATSRGEPVSIIVEIAKQYTHVERHFSGYIYPVGAAVSARQQQREEAANA